MPRDRTAAGTVRLVGLDFGSTTSSMLAIEADIASNCATGRMEFRNARTLLKASPVFTPFAGRDIDLGRVRAHLNGWLESGGLEPRSVFSGGAIVTGLAAERENARGLARLVPEIFGDVIVATADDPRLEAWLAFMGGAAALSRLHPERLILNLDIGGGTTNPALGVAGNVRATGSYFVGARHFEFDPGTYRLRDVSRFGRLLLNHLQLDWSEGSIVRVAEIERLVRYLVKALVAIVTGDRATFSGDLGSAMEQARLVASERPIVTFSGGVGELVYAMAAGAPAPPTTYFGDLGVDLAIAILSDDRLSADIREFVPEHCGRATVQGLTLNSTEISGTTLFLSGTDSLPLRDLPIVATLPAGAGEAVIADALSMSGRSLRGACLQIVWPDPHPSFEDVKRLGAVLASALTKAGYPADAPLVVLTTANIGKALGNYATAWRASGRRLVIIDEIPERAAHFVNVGQLQNGVVPVSFFGMS